MGNAVFFFQHTHLPIERYVNVDQLGLSPKAGLQDSRSAWWSMVPEVGIHSVNSGQAH